MKDLDNLIAYYRRRSDMYLTQSVKAKKDTDKAYNDGIAEAFEMAAKALEKVNQNINEKLKALL